MVLASIAFQAPKRVDAASAWPPRHVVAYRHEDDLARRTPAGFHEEQRPVFGLIVAGAIVTGMGAVSVCLGAEARAEANHYDDRDEKDNARAGASIVTTFGIVHLGVGVPILAVGLLARRSVLVPDRTATFTFAPIVGTDRIGDGFKLRF